MGFLKAHKTMMNMCLIILKMAGYLKTDHIGSYKHPDTLEKVAQSMDEGSSHSQAAVLPLRGFW